MISSLAFLSTKKQLLFSGTVPIIFYLAFIQVDLLNNTRIGIISSRPASISNMRIHFDNIEKPAKFPVGPTTFKPGPILLNVANTAARFVVKSKLSNEIMNVLTKIIRT